MIWIWNDYVVNSIILWILSFQIVQIRHVLAWSVVQRLHFHVYHELTGNPSDLLVWRMKSSIKHHRFHIIHTRVQSDNDGVPRTGLQKRSEEFMRMRTGHKWIWCISIWLSGWSWTVVLGGVIDGEDLLDVWQRWCQTKNELKTTLHTNNYHMNTNQLFTSR